MSDNIVKVKSMNFAIRIRKQYVYLRDVKKEFVMAKQGMKIVLPQRHQEHKGITKLFSCNLIMAGGHHHG